MKQLSVLIILTVTCLGYAMADNNERAGLKQIQRIEVLSLDTINGYESVFAFPDENLNDLFGDQMDSLYNSWFIQNSFDLSFFQNGNDGLAINSLPDSIYVKRLQNIDSFMELSFNPTVKNFIELYTQRRRSLTEMMLGLSSYYFPMFEEQLEKYNLPMELKYLPVIESALNPTARSRANAVGLWQFMFGTGKMYKLEINTFVDERRDPEKASEAAAKFLNDLYQIYKDWHLVIAAYNCGPGNVNKAIRRAGGARDYWSIYYYLPRETRGYVPAFIAAAYVMNYYQDHNLQPRYPDFPIVTDTIHVYNYVHFKQISEQLNIPEAALQSLNPQYRLDIIPAKTDKPYVLRLPIDKIAGFIDTQDSIYAHNRQKFFPNNEIRVPKERGYYAGEEVSGRERIVYTVRSGDNVGAIAARYKVSVNDLRHWNNIHKNLIRVGQRLVIHVPAGSAGKYAQSGRSSSGSAAAATSSDGTFVYYTVRQGDSLWSIARQFPGVSNQDIKNLNNLKSDALKIGQKLKIQRKS